MIILIVPKSMILWIEKLMANFLWNSKGEARAHWVSWSSICSPIEEGWLNIRTLDGANFGPNLLVQNTLLLTHPLQKRLARLCGLLLLLIIGTLRRIQEGWLVADKLVSGRTIGVVKLYTACYLAIIGLRFEMPCVTFRSTYSPLLKLCKFRTSRISWYSPPQRTASSRPRVTFRLSDRNELQCSFLAQFFRPYIPTKTNNMAEFQALRTVLISLQVRVSSKFFGGSLGYSEKTNAFLAAYLYSSWMFGAISIFL